MYVRKKNNELPKLNMSPFPELYKQIKILSESYYLLVLMILKQNYNVKIKTYNFLNSLPTVIKKLQQ
jgi:hypothetical protein